VAGRGKNNSFAIRIANLAMHAKTLSKKYFCFYASQGFLMCEEVER